jgi:hypothetical protein
MSKKTFLRGATGIGIILAASLSLAVMLAVISPPIRDARAQMPGGLGMVSMGVCQIPAVSMNAGTSFATCVAATFTATCTGTSIAATSVTGDISQGWLLSGTGIVSGTYITGGPLTGGAGTYTVSQPCTSSANSISSIGPPNGATAVLLGADTQSARFRDDGGAPTASAGMLIVATQQPYFFTGTVRQLQFISATAGSILNAAFYKTSSP